MSSANTATLACRVCGNESPLDERNVVRSAQIAAFVPAHRHQAGVAVALTIALTPPAAFPPPVPTA